MHDRPSFEAFRALVERCTRYDGACGLSREHDDLIVYQAELTNSGCSRFSRQSVAIWGRFIERLVIRIHHAMGATVVHEHPLQARNDARSPVVF